MMKKLCDKSVKELKQSLVFDKLSIIVLLIVLTAFNLVSLLYAFSIDPVLCLVSCTMFVGFLMLYLLILFVHNSLYTFLRECIEE